MQPNALMPYRYLPEGSLPLRGAETSGDNATVESVFEVNALVYEFRLLSGFRDPMPSRQKSRGEVLRHGRQA